MNSYNHNELLGAITALANKVDKILATPPLLTKHAVSYWAKKVLTIDEVIAYTGFKRSQIYTLTSTSRH